MIKFHSENDIPLVMKKTLPENREGTTKNTSLGSVSLNKFEDSGFTEQNFGFDS